MKRAFDAARRQYQVKEASALENLFTNDLTWPQQGIYYDSETQTYTIPTGVTSAEITLLWLEEPIPAGTPLAAAVFFESGRYEASRTVLYIGAVDADGTFQVYALGPRGKDLTGHVDQMTAVTGENVTRFVLVFREGEVIEPLRFRVMLVHGDEPLDTFRPHGLGKYAWTDGLKSGFPEVKLLGQCAQQTYTGKNLFNTLAVPEGAPGSKHISRVTRDEIVITSTETATGNGFVAAEVLLKDLAPQMTAGETYTLSFQTDSSQTFIYLTPGGSWFSGRARTVTEEDLNAQIGLYGFNPSAGDGNGDCHIRNIQIEKGTTVTEYEPYVGGAPAPSPEYPQAIKANNATVRSFGENMVRARIDSDQYLATSVQTAENVFQVIGLNFGGYGQIRVDGLPTDRLLRLVCTPKRKTAEEGSDNFRCLLWQEPNAGESMGVGPMDIPDGETAMTSAFRAPKGYFYCGLYPRTPEPNETTVQISVYSEEQAVPGHLPVFRGGEATAPDLYAVEGYRDEWDAQTGRGVRRCGIIECYAGEAVTTPYLSTTGALTEGARVVYGIPDTPFETAPMPLTCPTGEGQVLQVAGEIPDAPMELRYLAHGGNVK